jgi:hypothetical protein
VSAATIARVGFAVATAVLMAASADAQSRPNPAPQPVRLHAFFDVGGTLLTASESFTAATGSSSGFVFGGGGGVVLPRQIFVDVRVSRLT